MSCILRSATKNDVPAIARLHVAGWQGAYGGIVDEDYLRSLSVEKRAAQWAEWIGAEGTGVLLALDDTGEAAGFAGYGRSRTPPPGSSPIRPLYAGEVYALYLLPAFYRQGIGTALLRGAARGLAERGHKSLCLWVLENNIRAVSFYKKMGGERCGKKDVRIGAGTHREICFGWRDMAELTGKAF